QPGVRPSWGSHFDRYVHDNIVATQRLLEALREMPVKRLVFASSSSVYGDAEMFPTKETALPRPVSPYGMTKLAAEHLTFVYMRNFGIPATSLRYFTVYGPRQRPDMAICRPRRATRATLAPRSTWHARSSVGSRASRCAKGSRSSGTGSSRPRRRARASRAARRPEPASRRWRCRATGSRIPWRPLRLRG